MLNANGGDAFGSTQTSAAVQMSTAMTPPAPSGAAAASMANESTDRAAQTINVNVSLNATPAAVVMPTTMTPPSPSGAAAASVANESTDRAAQTINVNVSLLLQTRCAACRRW